MVAPAGFEPVYLPVMSQTLIPNELRGLVGLAFYSARAGEQNRSNLSERLLWPGCLPVVIRPVTAITRVICATQTAQGGVAPAGMSLFTAYA